MVGLHRAQRDTNNKNNMETVIWVGNKPSPEDSSYNCPMAHEWLQLQTGSSQQMWHDGPLVNGFSFCCIQNCRDGAYVHAAGSRKILSHRQS